MICRRSKPTAASSALLLLSLALSAGSLHGHISRDLLADGIAWGSSAPPAWAPAPAIAAPPEIPTFYVQPALPYNYSGQEPYIDTRTNMVHWNKHVAGYFANLNNAAAKNTTLQMSSVNDIILGLTTGTDKALRNNAGGVFNHLVYFKGLQPSTYQPNKYLKDFVSIGNQVNRNFGSMDIFKANFTTAAMGVFGSGWAWLTYNPAQGTMAIETTPNQDNPISRGLGYSGNIPLLGCDVWEHAYYLKHENLRADYIKDWFAVVNWPQVNANYHSAIEGKSPLLSPLVTW